MRKLASFKQFCDLLLRSEKIDVKPSFVLSLPDAFPRQSLPIVNLTISVTRWLYYFSIFGNLHK